MSSQPSKDTTIAPLLIGIAGGSASGKTTLARLLKQHAGTSSVTLLELDCFYRPHQEQPVSGRVNFDRPQALDLDLATSVVAELKREGRSSAPVYNFATHQREGFTSIASAPIVIIEGIFAFWHLPLREMLDLRIFVDTPSEERMTRRIRRDCEQRGRDTESVKQQWIESVLPMHDLFVEPMRTHADRIVDGRDDLDQLAIMLLGEVQFDSSCR